MGASRSRGGGDASIEFTFQSFDTPSRLTFFGRSMGIRFACHGCGKRLNIKNELAGRRGVCPACSVKMRIPLSDSETSTPIEEILPFPRASGPASAEGSPFLSEHEPEATWYVRPPSGGQYGPASTDLLRQWIEEGRVAATSLLWRDGWQQWRTASEALPEMDGQLPGQPVAGTFAAASAPPANDPLAAAVSGAPTVTSGVAVAGQAKIGSHRRARSFRRVMWIGVLSAVAIMLLGVLVVVANLG